MKSEAAVARSSRSSGRCTPSVLPPRSAGSFEHFGTEVVHVGRDDGRWRLQNGETGQTLSILPFAKAFLAYAGRLPMLTRWLPSRFSIGDHLPSHYVSKLTPGAVRSEFGD